MILTEAVAKTKQCPLARNRKRGIGTKELENCVASACMAWEFADELRYMFTTCATLRATEEPARPSSVPATWKWCPYSEEDGEPAGWLEPRAEAEARRAGYCSYCLSLPNQRGAA